MPRGGGAARFVILILGVWLVDVSLRVRRRSLNGDAGISACVVGGDGRGDGSRGVVSMDWRARHVE